MAKKEQPDSVIHDELNKARQAAQQDDDKPDEAADNAKKSGGKAPATDKKEHSKSAKKETEKASGQSKSDNDSASAELDKLAKEVAAAKEAHVRTLAEYDNYRKRSTKEKQAAYGDSKADVLKQLLPVLDNIDRAAQLTTDDVEAYKKGVDMIFTSLSSTLEKLGLESFGESGDAFDPNIHNAVMHIEDDSLDDNVVTDVFSKGYKLEDRILRPAMVKVAN